MKKILFLTFLIMTSVFVNAQDEKAEEKKDEIVTPWKVGGMLQLNFSQVYLDNWVAGGESSYAALGIFKVHADYAEGKTTWDNNLEVAYGTLVQGDTESRKSDDKFNLSSTYGYNAVGKWYYAANFTLKTQLFNGYNYPDVATEISSAFAPAEILYSLGIQYKPSDDFLLLISPLTGKTILVLNDELSDLGAFGVVPGEAANTKMGLYLKMKYKKEIFKNVTFSTKFDLFGDYSNLNIWDIDWEVALAMKVNSWLSANVLTHLIYNEDLSREVQFKEVFGLGLGVKF